MSRLGDADHESYEAALQDRRSEVVHAARQYIRLRNAQAERYGLVSLHTSHEGKALNAAVAALEKYESDLKVN